MRANDMYEACADVAARLCVEGAGFRDMVVGLSGGIDPARHRRLVRRRVQPRSRARRHASRPLFHGKHSLDDARELADNLGIETHVVSICEPFEAFEAVLRRSGCGKLSGTASENT